MTVANSPWKPLRVRRAPAWTKSDIEHRWRRTAESFAASAHLQLQQFEDRSVPSTAPFHAATSDTFLNSLLTSSAAIRNELVFIDPTVPDYRTLIADLQFSASAGRHFEFVVLSAARDGLEQITAELAQRSNVDAVHFVSHATGGALRLGNTWIDQSTLRQHGDQIATWSKALAPGADFLFYGCDLARTVGGQRLLQSIRDLTGADVAASADRTGSAILGGDWDLEYRAGLVETPIAFSDAVQRTYRGTLALFVVTSNNDSGAGTLRTAITKANLLAGTDTIQFNLGGAGVTTISLNSALPTITEALIIDGTTQPGYAGAPLIRIDGIGAGTASGLTYSNTSDGSIVRALMITRFTRDGIAITAGADSITVTGCWIGTAGTGTTGDGNGDDGIDLQGAKCIIGGTGPNDRNVITHNVDEGIDLAGGTADNNQILGNYIGVDPDGTSGNGNGDVGIALLSGSDNNIIGGATAAARNIISRNFEGIEIGSDNNQILGNFIGTDVTGLINRGNKLGDGVQILAGADNNIIGGTASGAGNVIAFNKLIGINAVGGSGNQFLGNLIHSNGGLGIDLNGDGPTLNDKGDGDSGANALKNFPVLTVVLTNGSQVSIAGTYNSTASNNYRIELFASPTADPSGYGEGARYLGFITITTDSSGNASFTTTFTAVVAAGEVISAIATDLSSNNSSEFSLAMTAKTPQVIVSPTSGLITTEAGGKASFTVVLGAKPLADVVIPISVSDPTEGSVAITNLKFTPANWNIAQTVTVTGVDDSLADGSQSYSVIVGAATSTDAFYNGLDGADVSLVNADNEVAGVKVSPTSGLTTTEAGGKASFTVVLTSQPVADVVIAVAVSNPAEGSSSTSQLTFTAANWNVAQTVTVTGVDDFIDDGNQVYSIVLSPAVSPGNPYDGVDPADVSITNIDDDAAGFIVTPTAGLVTTEAGGKATFTVRLTSQPVANVTINIASSNLAEGTVSVSSLTFTAGNWNIDQTVTITGVDEQIDDGNINFTIVLNPASSTDGKYNGLDPADVSVTNNDDDTAGFIVTPTTGLVTTEAGGKASFTVRLTSQPVANVTINIASSNLAEGTVSVSSLTFTAANWNIDQTVTITGVDDLVADGNQNYMIVLDPATSADGKYSGLDPTDVSVTNKDDDTASVKVTPLTGLVTTESGGQAKFSVVLTSQPLADVVITITETQPGEGLVDLNTLTFTPGNWNVPQIVTVTGIDDFIVDGSVSNVILLNAATSADPVYNGIDAADVSVVNLDDDVAGIIVNPTSGLFTTEAGGTTQFTVRLTSQPIADVVINIVSSNIAEGIASVSSLTFTASNWNVDQTVTITGVDDPAIDGNIGYTIQLKSANSTDPVYNGLDPADVAVTNNDDDKAGVIVTPTMGLFTTEAGGTASLSVRLTSQPVANVTINIASSNPAEGTVSVSSLTFTAANWNIDQTVIITGVDDAIADGSVSFSIILSPATSGDPNYNGLDPADVTVANNDDDIAGIIVTPTTGLVTTEAGGTATFSIRLTSQPLANVTINIASSNPAEGTVSVSSVTFTAANWNIDQTVIITGGDDAIADGNVGYSIVLSPAASVDSTYNGLDPADVSVINTDNDSAGIIVTPTTGLMTTEAGGTASFSVRLTSQPVANVTINIASSNPAEGTVSLSSLTFTAANWNIDQTVVIMGVDDAIADGSVIYSIILSPATSGDVNYNGFDPADVTVTNSDDDIAGIIVTPTTGLITTEAGGAASFSVRLTSQPIGNVTINIASSNPAEGTVSVSSLTFTAANWNIDQTVIITGVDDAISDGSKSYSIILSPATSSDAIYNGLDPADVSVINADNDSAGIIVTPTTGLTTTEAGGTASFNVRLTSQPLANVTINIASSNPAEGNVSVTTLTFTAANWNTDQTVIISGVDDFVADGSIAYTIVLDPAITADANYNGIDPADVSVTNSDNDLVGFFVTPPTGLVTSENGGSASFSVRLTSQPLAPVTINISSSNPAEGTISVTSLTFTVGNWNIDQTIVVTGVNDFIVDGNTAYTVVLSVATSADSTYDGLDPADVVLTNTDDDVAGVVVTPITPLITTESGGHAIIGVRLASQPSGNVVLTFQSSRPGEGTPDSNTFVFTPVNWSTTQFVTMSGMDDFFDDGDQAYAMIFGQTSSTDVLFDGLAIADIVLNNVDDDMSGFVIITGPTLTVNESGTIAFIELVLTSQPISPVTFRLVSTLPGEVMVIQSSAVFDGVNWAQPQRIEFRGMPDSVEDSDVAVDIVIGSVSFDPLYDLHSGIIVVTNANVATSLSSDPLATAVKTGAGVPGTSADGDQQQDRPFVSTAELVGANSRSGGLILSQGSGSGEPQGESDDANDKTLANDRNEMVPVNRAGLSPTGTQRAQRVVASLPADVAVGSTLPALRLEPMRQSMGKMDRDMQDASDYRTASVQVTVSTAAIASAGYVLWSLRGAAWVASAVASSLPSWSAFDPLVLLARKRPEDEDDDSLTDLIETAETV